MWHMLSPRASLLIKGATASSILIRVAFAAMCTEGRRKLRCDANGDIPNVDARAATTRRKSSRDTSAVQSFAANDRSHDTCKVYPTTLFSESVRALMHSANSCRRTL